MNPEVLTTTQYEIDTHASRFTVQAFASGLAAVVAHCPTFSIREFSGVVKLSMPSQEKASCKLVARAASLDILDDVSQRDRQEIERTMFHEVLNIQRFPQVVFESTQISVSKIGGSMHRVNAEGSLSLHGVTAKHAMVCQAVFGEDSLRIYGDCTLLQTDY